MVRPKIAFGTRELWPFVLGGGIGRVLHGVIGLLASEADITVITRETFREEYERMLNAGDPRLPHPGVRYEFLPDPEGFDLGAFSSFAHCWSALMYERLVELYPDGGPDLVEFNDYMGEGFVTVQARRSGHPSMRNARVVVGLHTSLEMIDGLDGKDMADEEHRSIYTLERASIAFADALVAPARAVLEAYARFYGEDQVAPGVVIPHVIADPVADPSPPAAPPDGDPTRLLFVGRLQRVKGVAELVEAAARLDRDDWELTLLGGDTDTAAGGGSMREHLARIADANPRIAFHDRLPVNGVLGLMDEHHVIVIPSLWECWSAVAREALSRNRPLLATPRGGLPETVEPGVSGWLLDGSGSDDIERGLRQVLDSRDQVDAMISSSAPQRRLHVLLRPEATLECYRELLSQAAPPLPEAAEASVSAVVLCTAGSGSVTRTLGSIAALEPGVDEVVLVCEGMNRLPDPIDLATVDSLELLSDGASAAACRNAGIETARGDLVMLVDGGAQLQAELVERLLPALRANPGAGYATAWANSLDPRGVPLGNFANFVPEHDNAAGIPIIRRAVFDRGHRFDPSLGRCAERAFYAALADDALYGCVVPERLASSLPFSSGCEEWTCDGMPVPDPSWIAP